MGSLLPLPDNLNTPRTSPSQSHGSQNPTHERASSLDRLHTISPDHTTHGSKYTKAGATVHAILVSEPSICDDIPDRRLPCYDLLLAVRHTQRPFEMLPIPSLRISMTTSRPRALTVLVPVCIPCYCRVLPVFSRFGATLHSLNAPKCALRSGLVNEFHVTKAGESVTLSRLVKRF